MIATTPTMEKPETRCALGPTYGAPWLQQRRSEAADTFNAIGLPPVTHEDWRLTNTAPIGKINFNSPGNSRELTSEQLSGLCLKKLGAQQMVFVDGIYRPEFSSMVGKAEIMNIRQAMEKHGERVQRYLGREMPAQANGFSAMNLAGFEDGAFLYLPPDQGEMGLVHLLWVTSSHDQPVAVHPRMLLIVGSNNRLTIVQSYAGFSAQPTLCNAVLEMVVGKGAKVELIKLQREHDTAFHIANEAIHVHEHAAVQSLVVNTGGQLVRNNMTVHLAEPFAEATLNGLTMATGNQHIDNHTMLDHARENCPSHELYKNLLGGRASAVFRGKILVRPDAQKTDSKQTSKTILLSDDAVMNSQPQLEIYADDVKCTHGSTTGPLDDEQLFYLRSRGVAAADAGALLTYAFARDVLLRIWHGGMREYLEDFVAAELHRLHLDQAKS